MNDVADFPSNSLLGAHLSLFKPRLANLVAGGVLSLLLIGGGLTILRFIGREVYLSGAKLPLSAERGMSWFAAGLGSLIGVALSAGGVIMAQYVWRLRSLRVEVGEYGFHYWRGNTLEDVRWGDIAAVQEIVRHERPPILKGPPKLLLPKFTSHRYIAVTRVGKQYQFDGNSIGDIARLGKLLREGCSAAGFTWEIVEEHA